MPGPRQALGGVEHGDVRRRAVVGDHEVGEQRRALRLRHQIAAQIVGLGDGGREADRRQLGRQRKQPREPEREQIAALRRHQRVQFVEHDAAQRAEQERRIGRRQDQRELLRRGQQYVRRIAALALPLRRRRVAGAGLDPDRQLHLGDRRFEVARDVDGERLQRRDIERVQPALAAGTGAWRGRWRGWRAPWTPLPSPAGEGQPAPRELLNHQARQKSRQRLAGAGRRDQQHRAAGARLRQQFKLMRARFPAALGKPARKRLGQRDGIGAFENGHPLEVMLRRRHVEAGFAATTTSPGTGMLFSRRDEAAVEAHTDEPRPRQRART